MHLFFFFFFSGPSLFMLAWCFSRHRVGLQYHDFGGEPISTGGAWIAIDGEHGVYLKFETRPLDQDCELLSTRDVSSRTNQFIRLECQSSQIHNNSPDIMGMQQEEGHPNASSSMRRPHLRSPREVGPPEPSGCDEGCVPSCRTAQRESAQQPR